ncbi:hypothetical protein ATANTOWER_021666 [Ataeniobius toweri]|uniref:Uncharacterized protein n=1 Tax=Ataeniobius toweri TaxID=208326 RepID=A0ABU7CCP7_9TELE|nr:hypothetical protein [Ataeniobius toweri]
MHVATVERKNSLLTGRNLQQNQAQCERPSATTDWEFKKTEQRHKKNTSTDPGVLSLGKKSKTLMVIAPLVASSRRERQLNRLTLSQFSSLEYEREHIQLVTVEVQPVSMSRRDWVEH